MNIQINFGGVIVALFAGFLASAVLHLSFAWCFVIGVGTIPALLAVLNILIWILAKLEGHFYRRSARRKLKRVRARNAERQKQRNARG